MKNFVASEDKIQMLNLLEEDLQEKARKVLQQAIEQEKGK